MNQKRVDDVGTCVNCGAAVMNDAICQACQEPERDSDGKLSIRKEKEKWGKRNRAALGDYLDKFTGRTKEDWEKHDR